LFSGTTQKSIARRVAFVAFPVVLLAGIILFLAYRHVVLANLRAANEASARAVTSVFANTLWPEVRGFVDNARNMPVAALRGHATTKRLLADVTSMTRDSSLMKVKLYDRSGYTVFSTDPAQIGSDYSKKAGFRAALAGGLSSEFSHLDRFVGVHRTVRNAEIFGAYLPVQGARGAVEGVIEVYIDVTQQYHEATSGTLTTAAIGMIGLVLLTAFGVQLVLFRRTERQVDAEREERQRLELGIECAEAASRAKSEFLSNMGHELRTPLNAIIGFSELIRQQQLGPVGVPQYSDYAGDIHTSAVRLLEVVNDVLSFSQAEAGQMSLTIETVDPGEALKSVVARLRQAAERKSVTLVVDVPPALPPLETDRGKLEAIFANLLSNAVKFTTEGGRIVASMGIAPGGDCLVAEIADTGIWMRQDEIPVALSPFGQVDSGLNRSYEGAGLGLPLTAKLVTLLNGSLGIESAPGRGTTVRVRLPFAGAETGSSAA
jgi:signal transduction histidine kinase